MQKVVTTGHVVTLDITGGDLNGEIWQKNYQKYLQTDHWQGVRREVWERDRKKCQHCLREIAFEEMQCHHLSYKRYNRHGLAFAQECIALCHGCHAKVHGHKTNDAKLQDEILAKIRSKRKATQ